MKNSLWFSHWQLEAVRLKESQWGPIEDSVEVRRVIAAGGDFEDRLLLRSQLLAQRADWVALQHRIVGGLRLSLIALSLLFLLIGAGVAASAFATQDGSVNVLLALVALLGAPTLSFIFWFASLFVRTTSSVSSGFGLSHLWLWLGQRVVKGPDQGLIFNALFSFASKQRLLRWVLGTVSHWLWLIALLSAVVTVLALLAAKRYSFNWETTLLSADSFVVLVQSLGFLPGLLGFVTPSAEVIRQSDGLQLLSSAAQVQWSSWLVGCLVVYGIVPRLIAGAFCWYRLQSTKAQLRIDTHQLGLMELRQRLVPATEYVGIDAKAGADQVPEAKTQAARPAVTVKTIFIGVELPADQLWPPAQMPENWVDAGLVDSREQRHALLAQLEQQSFEHIVLCADAEQTPDRGVVAWMAELATYGGYCSVYLLNMSLNHLATPPLERLEAWHARLEKAGFTSVYTEFEQLLAALD